MIDSTQTANKEDIMIKRKLKKANRYDDVMEILKNITRLENIEYPVNAFVNDDDRISYHIPGHVIRSEANDLIRGIYNNFSVTDFGGPFINLFRFVESKTNRLIHNYAVDITHRRVPNSNSMNEIRSWLVLWNILIGIDTENRNWEVPKGWRKLEGE